MNILKVVIKPLVIPLCLAIFIVILQNYLNGIEQNYWCHVLYQVLGIHKLSFAFLNLQDGKKPIDIRSSVFCRGANHTDRLCHFQNLCYEPVNKSFIFFRGSKSIQAGLPVDRFSPTLVDFSSIEDHNTLYFNYIEVPHAVNGLFNFSMIRGRALMFKRFNPDNLMHVFHDDLLPAFATLSELSLLNDKNGKSFLVFADDSEPGPYADLYQKFLPNEPVYLQSLSMEHLTCFANIYVGLNKLPTWYHYGFKVPQGPLLKAYDKTSSVILEFRDYFLKRFDLNKVREEQDNHTILFSRHYNRKIINLDEVVETIARITGLPTRVISLDTSSVLDIIGALAQCPLVVGVHGSLLILSLFLDPRSILIELFPFGIHSVDITPYRTLCNASGLHLVYRAWENTIKANTYPHPEYPANQGGIMHLDPKEQQRVKNSDVTPFLCCEDPSWLYRVYQDSLVETSSFALVLRDALEERQQVIAYPMDIGGIVPSDVLNISCVVLNTSLTLAWDSPWNLGFLNSSLVEYEAWIQEVGTNNVRAFVVKQKQLVLQVKSQEDVSYYVWVRCYADGLVGPFGSGPLVCST